MDDFKEWSKQDNTCDWTWAYWSKVGECSTECGLGVQRFTRTKLDSTCSGAAEKTKPCYANQCQGSLLKKLVF